MALWAPLNSLNEEFCPQYFNGNTYLCDCQVQQVIQLSLFTDAPLCSMCKTSWRKLNEIRLRFHGQPGLWCEAGSDMGSFGLRSTLLFCALGLSLSWDVFPSRISTVSVMSAARASEPHQTGISKLLSWVFRKGDTRTKGGYWQLVHFVAPLRFPNDACALIEITAN